MISQDGGKFKCQSHSKFPSPFEEENYKKYTIYVGLTNHTCSDTTVQCQCSVCTIITKLFVSDMLLKSFPFQTTMTVDSPAFWV